MDNVEFQFSLVIGSDIGEELCNFKNNKSCNTRIVEKILHYYKNYPIFTTSALMQKYYYDFPTILNSVLSNITTPRIDIDNSTEEYIAKHTIYKVVLCNDENKKDTFPYIYIGGDKIENNFTATFLSGEFRQKAMEHLKDLLVNAMTISIYDKNLIKAKWNRKHFVKFCKLLSQTSKITIEYLGGNNNSKPYKITKRYMDIIYPNWIWKVTHYPRGQKGNYAHDRYVIIDNKIEVIFTSGIHYLMNGSKDFTYIVRQHKQ